MHEYLAVLLPANSRGDIAQAHTDLINQYAQDDWHLITVNGQSPLAIAYFERRTR